MKRRERPRDARARLLFLATACLFVATFSAEASAQTPAPPDATPRAGSTVVDEDFELNIDLRRITEKDFEAATGVEAGEARGLRLRVGVALRAGSIDVLLRNVRGRVRFRASLGPVLRLLEARPAPQQPTPAP